MQKLPDIVKLKKRPEYLAVAKTDIRKAMPGLVVQYLPPGDDGGPIRVGLTVSARTGGAVDRSRIKRRLRAVITQVLPANGKPGATYVVIGRRAALKRPFEKLVEDLKTALDALHKRAVRKD